MALSGPWAMTRRRRARSSATPILRLSPALCRDPPSMRCARPASQLHTRLGRLLETGRARIPRSLTLVAVSSSTRSRRSAQPSVGCRSAYRMSIGLFQPKHCRQRTASASRRPPSSSGGAHLLLLQICLPGPESCPVPMALATGAVHHSLIDAGIRVSDSPSKQTVTICILRHASEIHWALCPWLALQSTRISLPSMAKKNMLKSFDEALRRSCRRWASPSWTVTPRHASLRLHGLDDDVIHLAQFPAPLGGVGFAEIEGGQLAWQDAFHLSHRHQRAPRVSISDYTLGTLPQG